MLGVMVTEIFTCTTGRIEGPWVLGFKENIVRRF